MLEQPYSEIIRLEKILQTFDRVRDLNQKRDETRQKNRKRHAPNVIREN